MTVEIFSVETSQGVDLETVFLTSQLNKQIMFFIGMLLS